MAADGVMTSCLTPHHARRIAFRLGGGEYWQCSWLPYKVLDREQAAAAMTIAELCVPGGVHGEDEAVQLELLCARIGVYWLDAMGRTWETPHLLDRRFHALSRECWCQPTTAWDGHAGEPVFCAMVGDPVDADGEPREVAP